MSVRSGMWTWASDSTACVLNFCVTLPVFLIKKTQKAALKCLERKLKGEKREPKERDTLEMITSVDACPDSSAHHFFEDGAEACWYQFSHYHAQFFFIFLICGRQHKWKQWNIKMNFSVMLGFIKFHQSHWFLLQCLISVRCFLQSTVDWSFLCCWRKSHSLGI